MRSIDLILPLIPRLQLPRAGTAARPVRASHADLCILSLFGEVNLKLKRRQPGVARDRRTVLAEPERQAGAGTSFPGTHRVGANANSQAIYVRVMSGNPQKPGAGPHEVAGRQDNAGYAPTRTSRKAPQNHGALDQTWFFSDADHFSWSPGHAGATSARSRARGRISSLSRRDRNPASRRD